MNGARLWTAKEEMKQRQEELAFRQKEYDLRAKLIEHNLKDLERKARSGELIQEMLAGASPRQTTIYPPATEGIGDESIRLEGAGTTPPIVPWERGQSMGRQDPEAAAYAPRRAQPAVIPAQPLDRNKLMGALAGVDPEKAAMLALSPEQMAPEEMLRAQGRVLQELGILAPPGGATGGVGGGGGLPPGVGGPMPSGGAGGGPGAGMQFVPNITMGKNPSIQLHPNKYEAKDSEIMVDGQPTRIRDLIDPTTGRSSRQTIGTPVPHEQMQLLMSTVAAHTGLNPTSPAGMQALGELRGLSIYTGPEQNIAFERWKQKWAPGGGGQAAGGGSVIDAATQLEGQRAGTTTRARTMAEPPTQEQEAGIRGLQNVHAAISEVKKFTPAEVSSFIKYNNVPELAQRAGNVVGLRLPERYYEWKAAVSRLQATAFDVGGKQLTGFEGQVVFGYTPTGNEGGGSKQFFAKLDQLERFTRLAQETRSNLMRSSRGTLDPATLEARMRAAFEKAGFSTSPPGFRPER